MEQSLFPLRSLYISNYSVLNCCCWFLFKANDPILYDAYKVKPFYQRRQWERHLAKPHIDNLFSRSRCVLNKNQFYFGWQEGSFEIRSWRNEKKKRSGKEKWRNSNYVRPHLNEVSQIIVIKHSYANEYVLFTIVSVVAKFIRRFFFLLVHSELN